MSKRSNSNSGKLQATALMCLVVAFTIAAASLFVVQILDGENTIPHPQSEQEVMNEEVKDTQGVDAPVSGKLVSVSSHEGTNDTSLPKYCYITVAFGEEQPTIHPSNTIKVNAEVCNEIGLLVYTYYYEQGQDLSE